MTPFAICQNQQVNCGHTRRHHAGKSQQGKCCVKPCTCPRFKLGPAITINITEMVEGGKKPAS